MSNRDAAAAKIAAEVASEGRVTRLAIRYYTEARLSMKLFREAINRGMAAFRKQNERGDA